MDRTWTTRERDVVNTDDEIQMLIIIIIIIYSKFFFLNSPFLRSDLTCTFLLSISRGFRYRVWLPNAKPSENKRKICNRQSGTNEKSIFLDNSKQNEQPDLT